MITERAAAEVLAGRGLGREQARQLLLTGVAGRGLRVGRSTAYDPDLVEGLVDRPTVDEAALSGLCPHGVHVAVVTRGRAFRCEWPWSRQAESLATRPTMTPMTLALVVSLPMALQDGLPWVATFSGFVVFVGTATGVSVTDDGRTRFDLAPAGVWREAVEGRWWRTGRRRHRLSWHPPAPVRPARSGDTRPG